MNQKHKDTVIHTALNQILDREFERPVDLWSRIQRDVAPSRSDFALPRRWTWKMVAVVCVLALAVTVYALNTLLQQAMQDDSGISYVAAQGFGQTLDVEQEADGVRLTLEWVYADSARISLGYTLDLPEGQAMDGLQPNIYLVDDEGHVFPQLHQTASSEKNQVGYIQNFDSSGLGELPLMLNLQLVGKFSPLGTNTPVGPFNLHFSVSTTAARKLLAPAVVEANGTSMTLRSVVTTPSMTRIELCYDADPNPYWEMHYTFTVKDQVIPLETNYQEYQNGCVTNIYSVSLYDNSETWTVTVTELVDYWTAFYTNQDIQDRFYRGEDFDTLMADMGARGLIRRITGPWIFTFTLNS